MYSPYSFNYNITSIVYYRHIDNSLYQKEWDVNVPLLFKCLHSSHAILPSRFSVRESMRTIVGYQ